MTTVFRKIKPELRIIGWDDSPFKKGDKTVKIFGTIFRGGLWMDGLLATKIKVDGLDATKKISRSIKKSRHYQQLRVIMLDGITIGGFNIIDINELYRKTKLPVIVTSRRKPDFPKIKRALKNLMDAEKRWKLIEKAGKVYACDIKSRKLYYQVSGIKIEDAQKIIKMSATRSLIPEPLRISHLIASGVKCGESYGRA